MKALKFVTLFALVLGTQQAMGGELCDKFTPDAVKELYCKGAQQSIFDDLAQDCKEASKRVKIAAQEVKKLQDKAKSYDEKMVLSLAVIDLYHKASKASAINTRISLLRTQDQLGTLDCR